MVGGVDGDTTIFKKEEENKRRKRKRRKRTRRCCQPNVIFIRLMTYADHADQYQISNQLKDQKNSFKIRNNLSIE